MRSKNLFKDFDKYDNFSPGGEEVAAREFKEFWGSISPKQKQAFADWACGEIELNFEDKSFGLSVKQIDYVYNVTLASFDMRVLEQPEIEY